MVVQHAIVRGETTQQVLAGVAAIDPENETLRAPTPDVALLFQDGWGLRHLSELVDVDTHRVSADPDGATRGEDRLLAIVDGQPHVLLTGEEEVAAIARRLEADDVIA